MNRSLSRELLLVLLIILSGCDDESTANIDAASADMGGDVEREDADTASDAGTDSVSPGPDARSDGGLPDGEVSDGAPPVDAGSMADAGAVDETVPGSVTWLHPDISNWPITSSLAVSFSRSQVCLEYQKKDQWPVVTVFGDTEVVANAWVFAERQGQWYAGTFEWLRPGQECKAQSAVNGDHIKVSPLDEASGWAPRSGDEVYFMVSGLIRTPAYRNVMERTNIVRATWP